jgi:alkanesulfonate monooxygenase SsuD/methylene tetrahydromethanopterin reductase-like flavin-dependent oxidoreductase (luciferase family)
MTQIGIMLEGQDGLNWQNWDAFLTMAEEIGYQCVFRSDHYTNASGPHKDALELWSSLTYAASHTKKIEFGQLVTPVTFRHPAMNVQHATAVDLLSNGRFIFGLGTGWQDREHNEFGIYFPPIATRYEMLVDALEFTTRLFGSGDEPVTYQGKHFSLNGAKITMKSEKGPRILIGGNGINKTLPLVAKYANEWNAVFSTPEDFIVRNQRLNELLEQAGRKPQDVKRSFMIRVFYRQDQKRLNEELAAMKLTKAEMIARGIFVGSTQEITDQIGAWAERGVERIMLQWLDLDDVESMAHLGESILPHFHK